MAGETKPTSGMSGGEKLMALITVFLGALISFVIISNYRHGPGGGPAPFVPVPIPQPPAQLQKLVYLTTKRCPWCDKMEQTLKDPNVKARLDLSYKVEKLGGKEAAAYKPAGYPAYVLFSPDGTEVRRGTGYRTPEEFLLWLDGRAPNRDVREKSGPEDGP